MIDVRQSRWVEKVPKVKPRDIGSAVGRSAATVGRTAVATPHTVRSTHDRIQWVLDRDPTGLLRPAFRIFGASTGVVLGCLAIVVALGSLYGVDGLVDTVPAMARAESQVVRTVTAKLPDALVPGQKKGPKVALDVPADYMTLYQSAAQRCDMDWNVLAAVGSVETNHGRSKAPGVHTGANSAGARGPMQFMDPTWAAYGVDGNGDGVKNVFDPADAIHGAANYLCANGAGSGAVDNALWHYNHDASYVSKVKATATDYAKKSYAMPLAEGAAGAAAMARPHHDYPAIDIPVPVGTPVFAVHGGRATVINEGNCGMGVSINGNDGATYLYCHASGVDVRNGQQVNAGDQIMRSGGLPGSRGAGSSTGPHLHLQIDADGHKVCPQGLIAAWSAGRFEVPQDAKRSGCST